MSDLTIRPAGAEDAETLWTFLAMAGYEPDAAEAKSTPLLAAYLENWPAAGDFGFIADRDGAPIGASWARQFPPADSAAFYCAADTPEMSVAVAPYARGLGVGESLVRALIAEATRRGLRLCLNVRETNPALRLYRRLGFQPVSGMTVTNRVGGRSVWMVLGQPPVV